MTVDRKQMIIDAATKSFSMFGYKATTLDQVAKLAKVGKGTIYTFYKNKEDLFDEIITSLIIEMKTAAEQAMDEKLTFYENAERALFKLLEFRQDHQLMIKLIQEEREIGTPLVSKVIRRLENMIVNYIKEIVQKAIDKGEIKPCNPKVTAFVMLNLYITLIFEWEKYHEPFNEDEISRLFTLYMFEGLSNR